MNSDLMNLKNFKSYHPSAETDVNIANLLNAGVMFLQSEDGIDWYESQKRFQPDTIKFTYDEQGIVRSISQDVSGLWPIDKSVAEVEDNETNRKANISGHWVFKEGYLQPRVFTPEEEQKKAEKTKKHLLNAASVHMAPLSDAEDLGIANEVEKQQLLAWKNYRVQLSRIDTGRAPNIDWPVPPAD